MPKHLKFKELLLVVMYVFFTVQATFLSYSQRFILSDNIVFSVITSMFFSTFSRLLNPSWPLVVTLSRISLEIQEDQLVLTVLQIPQGNNFPVLLFSVSVLIPFYQVPVNNIILLIFHFFCYSIAICSVTLILQLVRLFNLFG